MTTAQRAELMTEGKALLTEMDRAVAGSDREGQIVARLDELDALLGEDWWDTDDLPSYEELFAQADAIGARYQ